MIKLFKIRFHGLQRKLRLSRSFTSATIVQHESKPVRALIMKSVGCWKEIEVSQLQIPAFCAKNQIKVSVDLCGVNFADVYNVQGILSERKPPFVFGLECIGRVIDKGNDDPSFKIGDRVACYSPEGGLFQETVVISKENCFAVPEQIPSEDAVSLLANYLTAYFSLFHSANLCESYSILIHSIAGGVGWAATQLANTVPNVRVYGTCSESKHNMVKSNGVNLPLTYNNYVIELKRRDIKFNIVIDNIGGESIRHSLDLLKPLGHLVVTGANCVVSEEKHVVENALKSLNYNIEMRTLVCDNKSISGLHLGTLLAKSPQTIHDAMKNLFQLYLDGKVKPHIDSIWPLNKGAEAIKFLADRKNVGKVLLSL
uniref:Enoyl reductase (ER) domain-containing protein n=1 Tax=Clastoptera arizonana TaxID=38151 RepID=A0A1B6DXH5_9HEMI